MPLLTEADTCRRYVLPKLYEAGWNDEQISEQKSFTDGRIVVAGSKVKRRPQKRLDYLLLYRRDVPIAVVEAKTIYAKPGDGLKPAKEYAQLLTLATGTGKTVIAFQICYKLWNSRWNRTGEHRRPRILFLADRNVLVDDPKDKTFAPFADARWKIQGEAIKSREMYFATYQAIARDEHRPGLYREFPRDFFDLVIVDECHRGSARDESNWREILDYFEPAFQIGMTATPLRLDNKDTYAYFGNPLYTYSLKQGIEDGFLAPYRVHRVVSTVDAAGWRPTKGEVDRYGREVPDGQYSTKDFERLVSLKARSQAIARNLTDFLKKTDRFGKTIIFCVDQEHAEEMRKAINNYACGTTTTSCISTFSTTPAAPQGSLPTQTSMANRHSLR